jgi:hypothetical protein
MNQRMRNWICEELDNVAGGLGGGSFAAIAAIINQHCMAVPARSSVAGAVLIQATQTSTVCTFDDGDE